MIRKLKYKIHLPTKVQLFFKLYKYLYKKSVELAVQRFFKSRIHEFLIGNERDCQRYLRAPLSSS